MSKFIFFKIAFAFSILFSSAQGVAQDDNAQNSFGDKALVAGEIEAMRSIEPYMWLYQILMPSELQKSLPDRTQRSFKVHLQDSFSYFPHPNEIRAERLWRPQRPEQDTYRTLSGKITYVGIFPKTYRYDVITLKSGTKIMRVKIHFKNASVEDIKVLTAKLQNAENLWNASRWPRDFSYGFKFQIVGTPKETHYSISLKDKTRGPYDTYWSRNWSARSIAHEMGHMLGLGDEYETLTSRSNCLDISLMCASSSGQLMPHNFYFILRRLVEKK